MPLSTAAALRKDTSTAAPVFQHRHFAAMAAMIAMMPDPAARYMAAETFANRLGRFNPAFDRPRWMRACGFDA